MFGKIFVFNEGKRVRSINKLFQLASNQVKTVEKHG